ncbi:MAG: response regulator [Ectothiorhodospiraceae bacterium]|nr:response regulator [Ectothiorhodospiraceae bacterium]
MSGITSRQTRPLVYIVDDDGAVRTSLKLLLETHGLRTRRFKSCADFLAAVPVDIDDPPGVCLLVDAHMPGMNGADLQEHLQASGRDIPTILMTAQPHGPLATRAQAAGAREVIAKPIDGQDLLSRINQLLPTPT